MFNLPDLPYLYNSLEPFIDEETMKIHHDKHHAAYIKNVNDALSESPELSSMTANDLYSNLDKVPEALRNKVKNNLGGHINHTFFWEIMCPPDASKMPDEKNAFVKKMIDTFSTPEQFMEKFTGEALGRFGSGWAWLVVDNGRLEIISTANQDNPVLEGKTPVLGLDVWEHAYYLKYKNMRADYVKNWWSVVNWQKVADNFGVAMKEGENR